MKGFINLGNTCYFNACLQCLFQIPTLSNHLITVDVQEYPCAFVKEYRHLVREFWIRDKHKTYCDPSKIIRIFRQKFKRFDNCAEHDAQEVLLCMLDLLHKGTKNHKSTRLVDNKEWRVKSDSLIKDIFYGQIEKRIIYSGGESTTRENCGSVMLNPVKDTSLELLLKEFGKDEVLEGYRDHENRKHLVAVIQHTLINRPNIMIFCFNMFVRKVRIKVPEFFGTHKLIALCMHVGNLSNGHYVAYTKHKNEWYFKDDDVVIKKRPTFNDSYYFCIFKNSLN